MLFMKIIPCTVRNEYWSFSIFNGIWIISLLIVAKTNDVRFKNNNNNKRIQIKIHLVWKYRTNTNNIQVWKALNNLVLNSSKLFKYIEILNYSHTLPGGKVFPQKSWFWWGIALETSSQDPRCASWKADKLTSW